MGYQKPYGKPAIYDRHVLRILRAVEGTKGIEIAVVYYVKDGQAFSPQLEAREKYVDRLDKKLKMGKVKGLKWGDWKFLTETPERIREITELLWDGMRDKPRPPAVAPQERAANDVQDERERPFNPLDEEVPF